MLTHYLADTNSGERQTGRRAQMSNIAAAKTYVSAPDHFIKLYGPTNLVLPI